MNTRLNTLNNFLPKELSAIAVEFLLINTYTHQPLACGVCKAKQAIFSDGLLDGMWQCHDCRKMVLAEGKRVPGFHTLMSIVLLEDPVLATTVLESFAGGGDEHFPSAELLAPAANGFPLQFVRSDELYWGPAAPGFR